MNGHAKRPSTGTTISERRTEKNRTITRETTTIRTKSPSKATDSHAGVKLGRDEGKREKARSPAQAVAATARSEVAQKPWSPQATLLSHTSAPLASRISMPPLASLAPSSLQPQVLAELSLELQEAAIIEDLLFVFMGTEGQYIRYVDSYHPLEEKERLLGPLFRIAPGLDPSLRDLATSMLKMATHYIALECFIEVQSREECGAVNQALCAAVRKLLKDYLVLIAQLEHQSLTNPEFTLHILNLHTKPTSHMMFQLYTLACEVLKENGLIGDELDDELDDTDDFENILESLKEGKDKGGALAGKKVCKGGSVLRLITRRLESISGDPAARTLLTTVLREASRPYMTMLNEWLHHGGIKDPHGEFLIREQKSIKREELDRDYTDAYWEKRYAIRKDDVPPQLEGVKDKVLLAGKYLNVVRECGGVDMSKEVKDVPKTFDDSRFLDNVNSAYAFANSSLLNLLLTTHALPARLQSLKHYFFLDRSDFFSYFLELGNSELKKPAKHVNVGKLQSLLDIVLRQPGSVAAEDPFKEDVKVQMNEIGLTNWLMKIVNTSGLDQDAPDGGLGYTPATVQSNPSLSEDKDIVGFDALVLDYAVPFPLSLVVSRVTLTRYQLLFRYLLSLRHLETLLVNSWTDHTRVLSWRRKSGNAKIEMWKRRAWTLRARMLVFVQQLLYYCTAEVIEPNWQSLMARLKPVDEEAEKNTSAFSAPSRQVKRTVDELMQDHVDFLATCLQECMLTNSKLLRINSKVIATCTMFANFTATLSRYLAAADPELSKPRSGSETTSGTNSSYTSSNTQYDPARLDKMIEILSKYELNFTRHLRILLEALNYLAATETAVFMSLCARLSTATEGLPGGGGTSGIT
ncbi:hypothetical protein EV356DRAFT_507566 [Viridothelium virens]|uniref:Spindle pole body component n=1 Tax=Viridothelium virens TaxID=1048519 RepID=A0A6A6HJW9_VIRVR|nr:hypothetical protein EV356DRAFT_507566 [Viridothelium virens]